MNMKESSHTYEGVCHIHGGVMSQIRMNHVMHSKELRHEYERVYPHIGRSLVTHTHVKQYVLNTNTSGDLLKESCHEYEGV